MAPNMGSLHPPIPPYSSGAVCSAAHHIPYYVGMYVHSARTAHAAHAHIPCAHLLPYHLSCRVLTPSTCGLQGSIYVGPAPPRARARYIEGYLQATAPTRAHTTHMTPYTPLWGGMGPSLEGVRAGYRTTPAQRRAHTQGMEGVYPLCVPHTTPQHTTAQQRVLHTVLSVPPHTHREYCTQYSAPLCVGVLHLSVCAHRE